MATTAELTASSISTSTTTLPEGTTSAREECRPVRPNPIAALIRQGAEEAGRLQGGSRATTKVQRMINSLQWRQAHSKDDLYPLPLESGVVLKFRQLQAGEVTGLGTGATVWPAAHVLAKYLELRFGSNNVDSVKGAPGRGMKGLRAVDLGSGTGVAGIVAAALGADVFLTDQEQLLLLMQENADRALRASKLDKPGETSTGENRVASTSVLPVTKDDHDDDDDDTGAAAAATDAVPACGEIRVLTYDWGKDDDRLSPPLDVVLVSDCVLPKLYPIEPLVDAIDRLSGPHTVTIMSYEHRHYQDFDPRRRFEELAAAKGFVKSVIPQTRQHPIFSADDIEIWEVRRRRQGSRPQESGKKVGVEGQNADPFEEAAEEERARVSESLLTSTEDVVVFPSSLPTSMSSSSSGNQLSTATGEVGEELWTAVGIMGERHELAQAPSGAIGCYLWPSAVVMARHLVTSAAVADAGAGAADAVDAVSRAGAGHEDSGPLGSAGATARTPSWHRGTPNQYPIHARALELGSGVGLVAMTAALLGWNVLATDKTDAIPLLKINTKRCLSSTRRKVVGTVEVMEYGWETDARHLRNGHGSGAPVVYDVVMCADCVYARASVDPLLATLCQVCEDDTIVLVSNELRSAFDEFLQRARSLGFEVQDVSVPESQMVVDATSNQRPKPVALKRLRRRVPVSPAPSPS